MPALALFLRRNWQAALGLLFAAVLAGLLASRTHQRDEARAALEREHQARILFAERVRAAAERIRADFTASARRVERQQDQISQETSHDYQARISDLRRRLSALQLRPGPAGGADPGSAGRPHLPALPASARGADGAADADRLSLAERLLCSEQSVRLDALQRWVRAQAALPPARAGSSDE